MIKVVNGDICDAKEKYIVQQVNCQGAMGAGVAKAIYTKWPRVRTQYKNFCKQYKPESLLGHIQLVCANDNIVVPGYNEKIIVNCFSQLNYRRKNDIGDICYTNYLAFFECMKRLENDVRGVPIAMPYGIGCGLAGGDWEIIYNILCKIFGDENHSLTLYKK